MTNYCCNYIIILEKQGITGPFFQLLRRAGRPFGPSSHSHTVTGGGPPSPSECENFSLIGPVMLEIWLVTSASTFGQYSLSALLVSTLGEPLHLSIQSRQSTKKIQPDWFSHCEAMASTLRQYFWPVLFVSTLCPYSLSVLLVNLYPCPFCQDRSAKKNSA